MDSHDLQPSDTVEFFDRGHSFQLDINEISVNESALPPSPPSFPPTLFDRLFIFSMGAFLCIYIGLEIGFASWVTAYALHFEIPHALAIALASIFWTSLTVGRGIATALSLWLSPVALLGIDIGLCLASVLAMLLLPVSEILMLGVSVGLGLGCASIYPSVMALPIHLDIATSPSSSAHMVIGGSVGELLLPLLVGVCISTFGPSALPWMLLVFLSVISLCFGLSVGLAKRRQKLRSSPFEIINR